MPASPLLARQGPHLQRWQLSDAKDFNWSLTRSFTSHTFPTSSYLRAILLLFLKSIKKAQHITEKQLQISITESHESLLSTYYILYSWPYVCKDNTGLRLSVQAQGVYRGRGRWP